LLKKLLKVQNETLTAELLVANKNCFQKEEHASLLIIAKKSSLNKEKRLN
jgi:hypothetical protein